MVSGLWLLIIVMFMCIIVLDRLFFLIVMFNGRIVLSRMMIF